MKGSFEIRWKRSAVKELKALPAATRRRVLDAAQRLSDNPHPRGVRKLAGSELTYRLRVGAYRVVYTIFRAEVVIEIVRVRHRRDAYRS